MTKYTTPASHPFGFHIFLLSWVVCQTVGMEGLRQEGTEFEREGGKDGGRDEERQEGERDDSRE